MDRGIGIRMGFVATKCRAIIGVFGIVGFVSKSLDIF